MPRLVYATCEPIGHPHSTYIARLKFLDAIERRTPQVLDDLNGKPFEAYDKHRPLLIWDDEQEGITVDWRDNEGTNVIAQTVRSCLKGHNILTNWMLVCALLSLQKWVFDPATRWPGSRQHGYPPWWPYPKIPKPKAFSDDELRFRFEFTCPDPTLFPYNDPKETREVLEKKMCEAFKQQMKGHLNRLAEHTPDGFAPVLRKDGDRDFEWLVSYVIGGSTQAQIAGEYGAEAGITTQAVSNAIRETAQLIELPLPNRRGKRSSKIKPTGTVK